MIGLASFFLMPLVFALVIITIVGIALTPLVPLIYIIAMIMGIVAFSNKLGNKVSSMFMKKSDNIFNYSAESIKLPTLAGFIISNPV